MAEENQILLFQQEMQKIAEVAKAKGDSFVFKVHRRFSQSNSVGEQHILTFTGATVEQIANHELWLRSVTGGTGAGYLIATIYPTGENVNHCGFFTIRYEGNIVQGGKLALDAAGAPDWHGPQLVGQVKAPVTLPGTNSAAPPLGNAPGSVTTSSGNAPVGGDVRFQQDDRLQRLEAALRQAEEKAHLAELEKIRIEGEARVREIAAEAKRDKAELQAQLRAIEARVSAPTVAAESPMKPLIDLAPLWVGMQERAAAKEIEDRREARAEQQRRDDREAARVEAARIEAVRLDGIRREELQRREDRERAERKDEKEEQQRREDRLEAQRREDRERDDKREERMEAQRAEVLAQLREQQSGGALNGQVDLFANMAGKSMQMAAQLLEMQGPPAGEHPAVPIAREIAQIFKPFGGVTTIAKGATPAKAAEPAAAAQTVPATAVKTEPSAPSGKKPLIEEVVEMIRAHADPAEVARRFVGDGRTDDALQKELLGPPAEGDMRVLFVHHLGGEWLSVEENQIYVRQLLHAVLRYGIGHGIFKREIAAEYDVDIAELGLPNNGVTQGELQQTPEQLAARRAQVAAQGAAAN